MKTAPKTAKPVKIKLTNGLGLTFECTIGNSKIPTTTLIFNMGSATRCPSDSLGLCPFGKKHGDGSCYALKAERQYPQVFPFRDRQEFVWLNSSANTIATAINSILKSNPYITAVRVNESGDFHSIDCVNKLSDIASKIKVPVYTYTHRTDLFTQSVTESLHKNLAINFSTDMGYNHGHNQFRLPEDVPAGVKTFPCKGDCSVCRLCVKKRGIVIVNPRH
jgi:hypothetical protein